MKKAKLKTPSKLIEKLGQIQLIYEKDIIELLINLLILYILL